MTSQSDTSVPKDRVHFLNVTAAVIFELCDGTHTLSEIEEILVDERDPSRGKIERYDLAFLQERIELRVGALDVGTQLLVAQSFPRNIDGRRPAPRLGLFKLGAERGICLGRRFHLRAAQEALIGVLVENLAQRCQ